MKHYIIAFAFALTLAACAKEELIDVETAPADQAEVVSPIYEAGELAVLFSDEMVEALENDLAAGCLETKSSGLNQLLEPLGIKSIRRMFPHGGEFEARRRAAGLHKWYLVTFDKDIPQTKAAGDIFSVEGIEMAEPVRKIKRYDTGIDWKDLTGELWGMYNQKNKGYDINVTPVWRNYTVGNPDVIVGIFDDGVEVEHEDLVWNTATTGHYNYVDGTTRIKPGNHGTHVAGIVAATGNNGKGVCGVAGGDYARNKKGVTLISYQILTDDGSATDKSRAFADAADAGVLISQNSWGYNYDQNGDGKITPDEKEAAKDIHIQPYDQAAIDYFISYAGCDKSGNRLPGSLMQGGLVVFAAGNDAIPYGSPADYEPVIAVGAIASTGERSSFSSYGDWVDICAPGTDVLSTVVGNDYSYMSGTSMACPFVSGVAALVLSYSGGPMFTAGMLKEKLLKSSTKAPGSPSYIAPAAQIGGLVDALGAITYGEDITAEPVTDLSAVGRGDNVDLTWTLTSDSQGKPAYSVAVLYGKTKEEVEAATVDSHPASVSLFVHTPSGKVGEKVSCTVSGLDFSTEYFFKMVACTYTMTYSEPSEVVSATTTANNPPVIEAISSDEDNTIRSFETFTIALKVSEPDGHAFEVTYTKGSEADELAKQPDGTWLVTVTGSKAAAGTYKPLIKVTDAFGMTATKELSYTIETNSAPEIIKEIEDVVLYSKGAEFSIDMTEHVADPDGEALRYEIKVDDEAVAHMAASGNTIYGTALKYGSTSVEVKATDARGESVSLSFGLFVKDSSVPVSVYPNPVVDYVNIATLESAQTQIRILNVTGKVMYEDTLMVSGQEPARIDMSGYAPGVYTAVVSYGGNTYRQTVVKL